MSVWDWVIVGGVAWVFLCVGFVIGGLWVALFAERRISLLEGEIAEG